MVKSSKKVLRFNGTDIAAEGCFFPNFRGFSQCTRSAAGVLLTAPSVR